MAQPAAYAAEVLVPPGVVVTAGHGRELLEHFRASPRRRGPAPRGPASARGVSRREAGPRPLPRPGGGLGLSAARALIAIRIRRRSGTDRQDHHRHRGRDHGGDGRGRGGMVRRDHRAGLARSAELNVRFPVAELPGPGRAAVPAVRSGARRSAPPFGREPCLLRRLQPEQREGLPAPLEASWQRPRSPGSRRLAVATGPASRGETARGHAEGQERSRVRSSFCARRWLECRSQKDARHGPTGPRRSRTVASGRMIRTFSGSRDEGRGTMTR